MMLDDDAQLPPVKFVYRAPWPLTLTHIGINPQVPVVPPVKLKKGESVELWWVIEAAELHYEHAGSPRR